jgi:hypothetical protein
LQSLLQQSSASDLYALLDGLEEDAEFLQAEPPSPSSPPPDPELFAWAVAVARDRAQVLSSPAGDSCLALLPPLDLIEHSDSAPPLKCSHPLLGQSTIKVPSASSGRLELNLSPLSPWSCLVAHGFVPPSFSEGPPQADLSFALSDDDLFADDKRFVLETAEHPPEESFQLVECEQRGLPRDLMRFLRLKVLAQQDAFLLEPIFAETVWEQLMEPVSERNERDVLELLVEVCGA